MVASPRLTAVAVRLSSGAFQNFEEACRRDRLTTRSALEAAIELVLLFADDPERRQARVRHLSAIVLEDVVTEGWETARRFDTQPGSLRERVKVEARTEIERVAELKMALAARQISMQATLASVFSPWRRGWTTAERRKLRHDLWRWAAVAAGNRDFQRRRRPRTGF